MKSHHTGEFHESKPQHYRVACERKKKSVGNNGNKRPLCVYRDYKYDSGAGICRAGVAIKPLETCVKLQFAVSLWLVNRM